MNNTTVKNGGLGNFEAGTMESKQVSISKPQETNIISFKPQTNENLTTTTPQATPEAAIDKRTRKSKRVTNNFTYNIDSIINGENEIFTDIKDLVIHFIKEYNGRELESFRKTINRKDGLQYETLRIPKATVAATYAKLQSLMEIEEEQVSFRITHYTIKRVYHSIFYKLIAS